MNKKTILKTANYLTFFSIIGFPTSIFLNYLIMPYIFMLIFLGAIVFYIWYLEIRNLKECKFCRELINIKAIKCPHCQSKLD